MGLLQGSITWRTRTGSIVRKQVVAPSRRAWYRIFREAQRRVKLYGWAILTSRMHGGKRRKIRRQAAIRRRSGRAGAGASGVTPLVAGIAMPVGGVTRGPRGPR